MSATRCKKPHADILIGIEMTRERNLGIKKKHPVHADKQTHTHTHTHTHKHRQTHQQTKNKTTQTLTKSID